MSKVDPASRGSTKLLTSLVSLPTTMRAVQLIATGQPLADKELPIPKPAPGEVLVRVRAAGICHSDAHYRSGTGGDMAPPVTLGHEIAGEVVALGDAVETVHVGGRVAIDYLVSCGNCRHCRDGQERLCDKAAMVGKHRPGGFAEYVLVPQHNVLPLPDAVRWEQGAVLMCAGATALHALRRVHLKAGETVVIYGCGGLGIMAVQLARILGAGQILAVDLVAAKLDAAASLGAVPVLAGARDSVGQVRELTAGRGVDVALEFIGSPATMEQAVRSLAPMGRAALAGITQQPLALNPYLDIVGREAEILGVMDHTADELAELLALAADGLLDTAVAGSKTVSLEADAINQVLDNLNSNRAAIRTVISP